jgi:hypothetical protein
MIINKPNKYEEVQVGGDFTPIDLGGHKGIIKKVEEYTSQISGNTSLKVEVDTDKDDKQPNYYQEQYDNNTNMNKKWSTGATKYVSLKEEENCIKMLKSFITAVENSNNGFTYDWSKDIDQLNGKKVGLVFGLEEYQDNEGKTKTATKLVQFRSLDKLNTIKIPKVKKLDGTFVDYEEYKNGSSSTTPFDDKIEVTDDDVSFIL